MGIENTVFQDIPNNMRAKFWCLNLYLEKNIF